MEPLVSSPRDQETMGSGDENGFSHHCAFVWTGRNDLKTQRLDADFFEHGGENPQLSNKNDYMSSGPDQFSPKNTNTLSREKVVINHAMITKGKNALIFKQ